MLTENKFVKNLIIFVIIAFFLAGTLANFLNGQNFSVSASAQSNQNSTLVLGLKCRSASDYPVSSCSSNGTNTVFGNNENSVTNSSPTLNEIFHGNSSANNSGARANVYGRFSD